MARRCGGMWMIALAMAVGGCAGVQVYEPPEDVARVEATADLVVEGTVVGTGVVAHHLGQSVKAADGTVLFCPCTADVQVSLDVDRVVRGEGPKEGETLAFHFGGRCRHGAGDTFSKIFSPVVRPKDRVRGCLVRRGGGWWLVAHAPLAEAPELPQDGSPEVPVPMRQGGDGGTAR